MIKSVIAPRNVNVVNWNTCLLNYLFACPICPCVQENISKLCSDGNCGVEKYTIKARLHYCINDLHLEHQSNHICHQLS